MSEYHVVEVIFNDEDILVKSLKEMGYGVEIHNEGVAIGNNIGRGVIGNAHVVVRRSQFGGMGDIGFERTSDKGFVMHADDYDAGVHGNKFKLNVLNKTYTENRIKKYVNSTSSCSIFSRQENENGQIEIHLKLM